MRVARALPRSEIWRGFRNVAGMRGLSQFATPIHPVDPTESRQQPMPPGVAARSRARARAANTRVAKVTVQMLRDEARLLTLAGSILLAIGFPLALGLALIALAPDGVSPLLPITAGGPPILMGYLACHFASRRLCFKCFPFL